MSFTDRFWAAWLDVALPAEAWVEPLRPGVMATIAENVAAFPAGTRRLLGLGMRAYDMMALMRCGRPFSRLSAAERRGFAGWARFGLFGTFAQGASRVALFAFYQEPEVCRRIGYDPRGWVKEGAHGRPHLDA